MKRFWLKWSARIDALTLRERAMVFAAAAASIVFLAYSVFLNPLFARQAALRAQISQQRNNVAGIEADITQKIQAYALDPDSANRARLAVIKADMAQLDTGLRAMQKGLVAPERIAPLLESILKANARLRLVSMKTLPVASLGTERARLAAGPKRQQFGQEPGRERAPQPAELLYRHGVQVAVRGNYLDMVNYMSALEAMPAQLFWGKAQLDVDEYPNAQLTLTLYTLSLDQKWIKL
jgi:MSHA biogenesis protein MshJ